MGYPEIDVILKRLEDYTVKKNEKGASIAPPQSIHRLPLRGQGGIYWPRQVSCQVVRLKYNSSITDWIYKH